MIEYEQAQQKPFFPINEAGETQVPSGVNPQTVVLLERADIGALRPENQAILRRYFQTESTLSDLSQASGLSQEGIRLRIVSSLEALKVTVPDAEAEAVSLKKGVKRVLGQPITPFETPVRILYTSPETKEKMREAIVRRKERSGSRIEISREDAIGTIFAQDKNKPPKKVNLRKEQVMVLQLLSEGKQRDEISQVTRRSIKTIEGYLARKGSVLKALKAVTTLEAVMSAVKTGLIQQGDFDGEASLSRAGDLSDREFEIFLAIIAPTNYRFDREVISQRLEISVKTYESYVTEINRKLGTKSRVQTALVGYQLNEHLKKKEEKLPKSKTIFESKPRVAAEEEYYEIDADQAVRKTIDKFPRLTSSQNATALMLMKEGKTLEDLKNDPEFNQDLQDEPTSRKFHEAYEQSKTIEEFILLCNLRLIPYAISISFRIHSAEYYQEGVIGLKKAIERYDPEKGELSGYAIDLIKGEVQRALRTRESVRTARHQRMWISTARQISDEFKAAKGRQPTDSELINLLMNGGMRRSSAEATIFWRNNGLTTVSLDRPIRIQDGEGATLGELLPDKANDTERDVIDSVHREFIAGMVNQSLETLLKPKEALVIRMRFGLDGNEPMTLDAIGQKLGGLTRERIRQLEASAIKKLRESGELEKLK